MQVFKVGLEFVKFFNQAQEVQVRICMLISLSVFDDAKKFSEVFIVLVDLSQNRLKLFVVIEAGCILLANLLDRFNNLSMGIA